MSLGLVVGDVEDDAYVGKCFHTDALQPDGQWFAFLPDYEPQFNSRFDTYACTIFGTINALEILEQRLTGIAQNYSERFHYNAMPLRPPGGDPHAVAESIRKRGMVPQEVLPMTETFEEYVVPTPNTPEMAKKALLWLDTWSFGHSWLWRSEPSPEASVRLLKEALRHSPVGASVTAWHLGDDGKYHDCEMPNNHWTVIVGWTDTLKGTCFHVFDSYDHGVKILSPGHRISMAKRYVLARPQLGTSSGGILRFTKRIINAIISIFK